MQAAVKAHSAQTLAAQFDLHTRLFNNVLDGITDAEAEERARDTVNHLIWLAGHLTSTRFGMGKVTGLQEQDPWSELFSHGHGISDEGDYPSIDEIRAKWNAISGTISASLAHLPDEVLGSPAPAKVPINDETLGGMLAFLMHHEAYHIGQMGLLRKYLGKDAMSYA